MVTKRTQYVTTDQMSFSTKREANEHQNVINAAKELGELLNATLSTMRKESILNHIVLEEVKIRDILSRFHMRKPKSQKCAK